MSEGEAGEGGGFWWRFPFQCVLLWLWLRDVVVVAAIIRAVGIAAVMIFDGIVRIRTTRGGCNGMDKIPNGAREPIL